MFYEPLGHNPLINLYRKLTPSKRSEDEHPLHWKDIKSIRSRFTEAEFRVFHLLSLLTIPIPLPGHNILFRLLEGVDRILFWLPFLKKHAWVVESCSLEIPSKLDLAANLVTKFRRVLP